MNKIYIIQKANNNDNQMYASNINTTDARLQGYNVEKVLVDYFKKFKELYHITSSIDVETIEGDIYETLSSTIGDINDRISVIKQSADKIDLLVKSADGSSSVTLTDKVLEAISGSIKLTAANIDLCGYISNRTIIDEDGVEQVIPGNWYISEDGAAGYKTLAVEEDLSCDTLSVKSISNPQYPKALTGSIDVYVDATNGSDDVILEDECTFKTLEGLLDKLPKNLNGSTVRIYLKSDISAGVTFNYFFGGRLLFFLCGLKITGYLRFYCCNADIKIYGGDSQSSTARGIIAPDSLYVGGDNEADGVSILVHKVPFFAIYYCDIYGNKNKNASAIMKFMEFSSGTILGVKFIDGYHGVIATSSSIIYATNTSGQVKGNGWVSQSGSIIHLANGTQMSGTLANYKESNGDIILGTIKDMIKNSGGNPNITPDPTPDPTPNPSNPKDPAPKTKTVTYKATSADTYRSSVYNNWKKDGTCRQGDYGYGDCNGCWFFGSQFANLKGKNITSIKITIKRQTGGYQSAHNVTLKMHKYASRPSISSGSKPTYNDGWSKTISLKVGESKTVTITDTAVLNAIKNGTMKGFGLQGAYNKASYTVCSGAMSVVVTYKE